MGKALKIILGIILCALGIAAIWYWRWDVLTVIRGSIGIFVILAGLIAFAIAAD